MPIALAVLTLSYLAFLIEHRAVGLSLTDGGFYAAQLWNSADLTSCPTQYGALLSGLTSGTSMEALRLINLIAVPMTGLLLGRTLAGEQANNIDPVAFMAASMAAAASTFFSFIVEPTYNNLSVALTLLFLTASLRGARAMQRKKVKRATSAHTAAGTLLIPILLTKASFAATLALVAPSVIALASSKEFRRRNLLVASSGWLMGMGICAIGLRVVGFQLGEALASLMRGVAFVSAGGAHEAASSPLSLVPYGIRGALHTIRVMCSPRVTLPIVWIPFAIYLASTLWRETRGRRDTTSRRMVRWLVPLCTAIAITTTFLTVAWYINSGLGITAGWSALLAIHGALFAIWIVGASLMRGDQRLLTAALLAVPGFIPFGSSSEWAIQWRYTGALLMAPAALYSIQAFEPRARKLVSNAIAMLCLVGLTIGFQISRLAPYGSPSIAENSKVVTISGDLGDLWLSTDVHRTVSTLLRVRNEFPSVTKSITLDLTKNLQVAPILLGSRFPPSPYPVLNPNNPQALKQMLAELPKEELERLTLVTFTNGDGSIRRTPATEALSAALHTIDLSLQQDFTLATTFPYPDDGLPWTPSAGTALGIWIPK